jgi:hypothetical protein
MGDPGHGLDQPLIHHAHRETAIVNFLEGQRLAGAPGHGTEVATPGAIPP